MLEVLRDKLVKELDLAKIDLEIMLSHPISMPDHTNFTACVMDKVNKCESLHSRVEFLNGLLEEIRKNVEAQQQAKANNV